jgi:hypothetical protein
MPNLKQLMTPALLVLFLPVLLSLAPANDPCGWVAYHPTGGTGPDGKPKVVIIHVPNQHAAEAHAAHGDVVQYELCMEEPDK